jgi:hypothetical protein
MRLEPARTSLLSRPVWGTTMRSFARRAAAGLICLVAALAAGPARAQYQPPEPPPPVVEPEPAPTPEPDRISPPGRRRPAPTAPGTVTRPTSGWEPLLVVEAVYENNVGFTALNGPDALLGSLKGSLTRWHRSPRGSVRLQVVGSGFAYREPVEDTRGDAGASARISRQLSPRVRVGLRGDYDYGHTDNQRALIESGVLLPLVRTRSGSAAGDLSWRLAEQTTLSFNGAWRRIDFDSDLFLDTVQWTGGAALSRRLTPREDLSLGAQLLRTEDDVGTQYNPSVSLDYTYRFTRDFKVLLGSGVGWNETRDTVDIEVPERRWNVIVSGGLQGRLRRAFLSILYRRGLQPAVGLGQTDLTDSIRLNALVPVGRRLELLATGVLALRTNTGGEERRSRDADVFTGAALRLGRRLRLVAGYRFRVRDSPLEPEVVRNNRASLSLAWGPEDLMGSR